MPRIRETPEAFIVEPTGAEQWGQVAGSLAQMLPQMLPQMLLQLRQLKQQEEERKWNQTKLRIQYNELSPEQQTLIADDPNFIELLTGQKVKPEHRGPGGTFERWKAGQTSVSASGVVKPGIPSLTGLPIRDLTPEEITARKKAQQDLTISGQQITRNDQAIEEAKTSLEEARRRLKAYGTLDKMPADQVRLEDYAVAYPNRSMDEISDMWVARRYPGYESKIAEMRANAGPEVDRIKTNEAFKDCVEKTGTSDGCFAYAEAMGTGDLSKLKGASQSLKTLGFKNYELNLQQRSDSIKQMDQQFRMGITSTALRLQEEAQGMMPLPYGFRVNAQFRAQSGPVYNLTTGRDDNLDGVVNDRPADVTRNSLRGDGYWNIQSLRLTRQIGFGGVRGGNTGGQRAGGGGGAALNAAQGPGGGNRGGGGGNFENQRYSVELFLNAQNPLNRVIPQNYSGNQLSPFFGLATGVQQARRVNFGMSLRF